jgi:hypothetical protein
MTAGTRAPIKISAKLLPPTTTPVASPRRRATNQAGTSTITGTLAPPLPAPVTNRHASAWGKLVAEPVSTIASPVASIETPITQRGP